MRAIRFLRRHWKRMLISLCALMLLSGTGIYVWAFTDMPDVSTIEAGFALPSTRIYDRNGALLYEILPPEQGRNRIVSLEDIPQQCVNAVIATEDANYWSHAGVDLEGIARALWINLRGGEIIAGGSTITQQTARLLLLDPAQQAERTVRRKLREMVLALQLQNANTKDHVLSLYLNQVYFGNLAYGIEAAAQTYFHKSAPELSLAECAMLAGIVQNAVFNDPLTQFERAKDRQSVSLRLMAQAGYITEEEAVIAAQDELQFGSTRFPIEAPHFVMSVWQELEQAYPDQLYGGGLDVITTVDRDWQRTAQEIAQSALAALNDPLDGIAANAQNAAVVAMDPHTGQILTMLGSPDYFNEAIDGAVNAAVMYRQPGSALKPFTYAAAMHPDYADPYTAATLILDVETPFVTRRLESYTPSNFGRVEHGPVLAREALGSSLNIPAVIALEHVGTERFMEFVGNIGMENLNNNADLDLSITLGGGEVRLLDLVQGYSIFPNGGFRIEPSQILQVSTRDGEVLYEWNAPLMSEAQRVLDERIAFIVTDMLADNNARIPAFGVNNALQIGRPAAAKTGTTTDFRDNWVVGYTPNLVVGVWVGNADNRPMVEVTGVSGAGPIYNSFMRRVLLGQPELDFVPPEGLTQIEVCELSGMLPTPQCPHTRVEWFIPGTEPTDFDTFYQEFAIDTRTGFLADENTPVIYRTTETFVVLPQEARDWAIRNGIPQPPPDAEVVAPDAGVGLRLLEPDPYTEFELSPIVPIETQRIRFTVGTSPNTISVTYFMDDVPIGTVIEAPWDIWWQLELGAHELVAEATLADGSTERSESIRFGVVDYTPLEPQTILPGDE